MGNPFDWFTDALIGKKQKGQPAGYIPTDPDTAAQQEWARQFQKASADEMVGNYGQLGESYGDPYQIAMARQSALEKNTTGGLGDARRTLRERLAKIGMGASSVGMGSEMELTKNAADTIAQQRAMMPENIRRLALERSEGMFNAGAQMANAGNAFVNAPGVKPTWQTGTADTRTGGLLPVIGQVGGGVGAGMLTGWNPSAMMMGSQLGGGLGNAITGYAGGEGSPLMIAPASDKEDQLEGLKAIVQGIKNKWNTPAATTPKTTANSKFNSQLGPLREGYGFAQPQQSTYDWLYNR